MQFDVKVMTALPAKRKYSGGRVVWKGPKRAKDTIFT